MTSDQFVWWLRGYLQDKSDDSLADNEVKIIVERLNKVDGFSSSLNFGLVECIPL